VVERAATGRAGKMTTEPFDQPGKEKPMTAKRVVFTGGTGKAGRHALPHLKSKGYDVLNVDLAPSEHADIKTLIADLTDSGQAFNALTTHPTFAGFALDIQGSPQAGCASTHVGQAVMAA